MRCSAFLTLATIASFLTHVQSIPTTESLITTAAQIAQAVKLTLPNPGLVLIPQPYYWWQSGIVNNALLTYGFVTGDKQFEDLSKNTVYTQATSANDFMMPDATGNDDQSWWALSALTAAENSVAVPAGSPTFLSMAQNVFNEQKGRWDTSTCGGGMKFKINAKDAGYTYKSSIANGLFFQLAARLASFTGDADALGWAEKSYTWMTDIGLIDGDFNVYDGTYDETGCASLNYNEWSYNVGAVLYGAAVMAAHTSEATWVERTKGLLGAAQRNFVKGSELYETACEGAGTCNNDQVSFKGILARWMGATAVVLPELKDEIAGLLSDVSAQVQSSWTPALGPMQHFVALEIVDAAVRANGGVAAVSGMIGGSKNVAKREAKRSVAGRILWET